MSFLHQIKCILTNTIIGAACILITGIQSTAQENIADPFKKINTVRETLEQFNVGEIKPTGWIKQQIEKDLEGFTGHLDSLVPDLIIKDDIYGKNRLTKKVKSKDVGAISDGGDWQVQFLWWNSETQSNWWDGYIRSAILANDAVHLARAEKYISRILSTQDEDGYLGIYDKELRYKFDNENGELWSKSTLLRGLLAWYEYRHDQKVLTAIEKAVNNVMLNYPVKASHPFNTTNPNVGGLTHGLTFTDVLERLYQLTGKQQYLDYALFLYKDFSLQNINEDAHYKKLSDTSIALNGHGVHTYEHLRSVAAAYYASGNPALKNVLDNFLYKISKTTTVSGGPIGDEFIFGRKANETNTGYEYCSLHELLDAYGDLLLKTGNGDFGDKIERLFFNAAEGARNPDESCIAYLKTDNSYFMNGPQNGDTTQLKQTRYSYSPTHQEAAVCCVPNAGRITPYFVQHMWMKDQQGLIASLAGPCELYTTFNGSDIIIKEITGYPFTYTIKFEVQSSKPTTFNLRIRKPSWAKKITVSNEYREQDGYIIINKNWEGMQTITITYQPAFSVQQDANNEYYFTFGPHILAHPIQAVATETKKYVQASFRNLHYNPKELVIYQYNSGEKTHVEANIKQAIFKIGMYNPVTKQPEIINLQPMGKTILRQVTFKDKLSYSQ